MRSRISAQYPVWCEERTLRRGKTLLDKDLASPRARAKNTKFLVLLCFTSVLLFQRDTALMSCSTINCTRGARRLCNEVAKHFVVRGHFLACEKVVFSLRSKSSRSTGGDFQVSLAAKFSHARTGCSSRPLIYDNVLYHIYRSRPWPPCRTR